MKRTVRRFSLPMLTLGLIMVLSTLPAQAASVVEGVGSGSDVSASDGPVAVDLQASPLPAGDDTQETLRLSQCSLILSFSSPIAKTKSLGDIDTAEEGYQCLLQRYVQSIDDRVLIAAAWKQVNADDGIANPNTLSLSGDPDADWAVFNDGVLRLENARDGWRPDFDAVIDAMARSLNDQHSYFETPAGYEQSRQARAGHPTYVGIGITLFQLNGHTVVTSVIAGGPADRAGMQKGDDIVSVGGTPVGQLTLRQLSTALRGSAGVAIVAQVIHHGMGPLVTIVMQPAELHPPVVTIDLLDTGTAYIKLGGFSDGSAALVGTALQDLKSRGAVRVILDLRGNGGGSIRELAIIAGLLTDMTTLGTITQGDGVPHQMTVRTTSGAKLPLVVMVDRFSASASEVLAGAVQETRSGTIVGEHSAGAVDALLSWSLDDGSVLDITEARVATPSGKRLDRVGVTPDVQIEPTLADLYAGRDVQRDAAVIAVRTAPPGH